ncbi:HD-GYP domain-containing protein [Parvularcula sp. LCG005]|uniref:HD-GYP domain-containing protein n=1 Tax=Parvularcula sp. LCG005 TaxID=3078805 RepID=UPI00397A483E
MPLAELLGALSYALDLTEGQPEGHCLRTTWIGTRIGEMIGLPKEAMTDLYYTLLIKDVGCSSNAARIAQLYQSDDRAFKHGYKIAGTGLPSMLSFLLDHTGVGRDLPARFKALATILTQSKSISTDLIQTRCTRGAAIARDLRFSEDVARGIRELDEHWNGGGLPNGLQGAEISIYSRIALLSQVIEVFHFAAGRDAALEEIAARRGKWFDPMLVDAFESVAADPSFWDMLASPNVEDLVMTLDAAQIDVVVDDDFFDDITRAFGSVVDAKSPYTAGHSDRVCLYADQIAETLGMETEERRWLRRAALLHDVGKLGVSNTILDKPGQLDEGEWEVMRDHAMYSEKILSHISAFGRLAFIAAAHHEKLDGTGYPRRLKGDQIPLETRIITIADFFDALTADRPYRDAMPIDKALAIIESEVGSSVDPICYQALCVSVVPRLRAERFCRTSTVPARATVG